MVLDRYSSSSPRQFGASQAINSREPAKEAFMTTISNSLNLSSNTRYPPRQAVRLLSVEDQFELPASASFTTKQSASPEDAFSDISQMSFADLIRMKYLEEHHLSEDDLKAMPGDQQQEIQKEIAEEIKRQLIGSGGNTSDLEDRGS
jgi:hypothetical protein